MIKKTVYIVIPHVTPALEISCARQGEASYLEHLFFPYIRYDSRRNDYFKMSFVDSPDGRIKIYDDYSDGTEVENIIRYVESFFIKNACAIDGYIMLHGGAISHAGKAVAIVGNSFAGKSTATAYLCSRGFEYLTDDRVLINTNTLEVTPFQRKIMLRPDSTELLSEKYHVNMNTKNLKLKNVERHFYMPASDITQIPRLKKTVILNRHNNDDFSFENIEYSEAVKRLLMYGMNVKNYKHIDRYRKIASCGVSEVHYSNLCDLENYILEALS